MQELGILLTYTCGKLQASCMLFNIHHETQNMRILWRRSIGRHKPRRAMHTLSAPTYLSRRRPLPQLPIKYFTTLFYSSIIAVGAAVDVHIKQTRRSQWNKAIYDVETEIDQLRTRSDDASIRAEDLDEFDNAILQRFGRSTKLEETLDGLLSETYDWRDTKPYSPQSIHATSAWRQKYWMEFTPKKLATIQTSIAMLAAKFQRIALSEKLEGQDEVEASKINEGIKKLDTLLERLTERTLKLRRCKADDIMGVAPLQHPAYSYDEDDGLAQVDHMNAQIRQVFRDSSVKHYEFQDVVSHLSRCLIHSRSPPNHQTYNELLQGFLALATSRYESEADKWKSCVRAIRISLHETHIRPDDKLMQTVLKSYLQYGQYSTFEKFVKRIYGEQEGLMLSNHRSRYRLHWRQSQGRLQLSEDGERIHQSVDFNEDLALTIIQHYLHFEQWGEAFRAYDWMKKYDYDVGPKTLNAYLEHCAKESRWTSGKIIWDMLKTDWIDAPQSFSSAITKVIPTLKWTFRSPFFTRELEKDSFRSMLHLCRRSSQEEEYNAVLAEAEHRGWTEPEILRPATVESGFVDEEVIQLRRQIEILERRVHRIDEIIEDGILDTAWARLGGTPNAFLELRHRLMTAADEVKNASRTRSTASVQETASTPIIEEAVIEDVPEQDEHEELQPGYAVAPAPQQPHRERKLVPSRIIHKTKDVARKEPRNAIERLAQQTERELQKQRDLEAWMNAQELDGSHREMTPLSFG